MTTSNSAVLIVGTSDACPDLRYASGFTAPDPVVLLAWDSRRWLVVPQMELGRARHVFRSGEVLTPEALRVPRRHRRETSRWALALVRSLGIRRATVPESFPLGAARLLERHGVRLALASGSLFPGRETKTAGEQRLMRESQQAAVIAMRAAVDAIARAEIGPRRELRSGGRPLTSERVQRLVAEVLLAHNCAARDIIVAGGRQAADPHEQGAGPLHAGETIVLDIFPQSLRHGYWGDLTRTIVRGEATSEQRRLYAAVRAAQAAALARVRPGARCAAVHAAAAAEFDRRGYATRHEGDRAVGFIHGTGHGVGLAIHEAPAVTRSDGRLRAGHVITVEPGLYYPDIGGVRIEDTVVVTRGGWRYLAPCEKRFEV